MNLSQVFNTEPMEVVEHDYTTVVPKSEPDDQAEQIQDDYEEARKNLYEILRAGKNALEYSIELAKSTEHPKGFEVVGNLMKQLADINLQLMELQDRTVKLKAPKVKEEKVAGPQKVVNNSVVFTGTPDELGTWLQNMRKDSE